MRIGILSDIHEAVELLEVAIERLTRAGVDRFVVLGDVFETGPRLEETVRLLESIGAVGVFGNHDYGLCVDPSSYVLERFPAQTLAYLATLRPRLELEGCFFAHREPWLDGSILTDIWHVDEDDLPASTIDQSFAVIPDRPIFIGHYHRWRAFGAGGPVPWEPPGPLILPTHAPSMVIVAAVCDGHAAILETKTRVLTPIDLYDDRPRPEQRPLPRLVHD